MSKTTLEKFGEKVREERLKRRLSQEELASKAGVHRTYIGMIERAEKIPTYDYIIMLEYKDGSYDISCKSFFRGGPANAIININRSGKLNPDGSITGDFRGAFKATKRAFEKDGGSAVDKQRSEVKGKIEENQ